MTGTPPPPATLVPGRPDDRARSHDAGRQKRFGFASIREDAVDPERVTKRLPDLVLLPGFMCDQDLWTDMVPDLENRGEPALRQCLRGHLARRHGARVLAAAPERFVLVGFSMGGFVARVLCHDGARARVRRRLRRFVGTRLYGRGDRAAAPATSRAIVRRARRERIGGARPASGARDRPVLLDRLRGMQRRLGREVRTRQAQLVSQTRATPISRRITCPSLVVACRQDRLRQFAETERMARTSRTPGLPSSRIAPHGPLRTAARAGRVADRLDRGSRL